MAIKKKSIEDLQEQAKGFLDFAEKNGKINKKTKNDILRVLGLKESEKKGFFEQLSKIFGKKLDIYDKSELETIFNKKKFNFEQFMKYLDRYVTSPKKPKYDFDFNRLWKEYEKYIKVENFLKPYRGENGENSEICENIFDFIYYRYEDNLNLNNIRLFLNSKIFGNISRNDSLKEFIENIARKNAKSISYHENLDKILNSISNDEFRQLINYRFLNHSNRYTMLTNDESINYLALFFDYRSTFDDLRTGFESYIHNYYNGMGNKNLLKNIKYLSNNKNFCSYFSMGFLCANDIVSLLEKLNENNFENIFDIMESQYINKFFNNLSLIVEKYGDKLSLANLKSFEKILNHGNTENLKFLLSHKNINEIIYYENIIINDNIENIELIFNKFSVICHHYCYDVTKRAKPKNLKLIFDKFKDITLKDIDSRMVMYILEDANYESLNFIIKYLNPNKVVDIQQYEKLYRFDGSISENLNFKEKNHKGYLKYIYEIIDTNYNSDKRSKMIEKVVTLKFEQAENYVEVFKMLDDSISMDIQRIKDELIDELLESENPQEIAEGIINIFERNNLPLTGKIFKVFELLYPKEKIKSTLQSHGSPVLHQYLDEGKKVYNLIYRDLMNIAIKSGDRSLRDYLSTFVGSEELLKKFEEITSSEGFDGNDPLCLQGKFDKNDREKDEEAQAKLLYLFRKISVLYNRYYGKEINEGNTIEDKKYGESTVADNLLVEFYNDIKKGFHLRKGESIYDRLQRFLLGLGYHSFNEVLEDMNESKKQAHERGLNLYNEAVDNGGKIKFPRGAFLKGVDKDAFSKIINRGVTCREYLGGGDDGKAAGSDATPFDIDGLYLDSPTNWNGYGNILLITDTNRCNIIDTRNEGLGGYKENQYELFKTGVVNQNHYGIRTGIPTTEVDYIIFNGSFDRTTKVKIPTEEDPDGEYVKVLSIFQNMCYEIARNGYYIPIVDNEGNVKFTPEMYHQIRAGFNYMQYYDGFDVEQKDGKWVSKESDNEVHKKYIGTNKEKITDDGLRKLISDNSPSNEKYSGFAKENKKLAENTIKEIKRILHDKCGISFNSKHDTSITGAELHDSGSTGRGTDIPTKDVDLDFTLLLDAKEYDEKLELIKETIYRETGTSTDPEDRKGEGERKGGYQMKSKKNTIGQCSERPNGISLDLLILKKSQVIDYSSSDAMKEKLNFIKDNLGKEDLNRVRTNVIIMKKLLKSQSCYKKTSAEGGIAGIGVENWITQHHGSFIEALESFEKVAYEGEYGPGRQPIPLERFKELYPIYDAGENYKDGCNDNFVEKINEHGYNGMLNIVIALRTKGIEGIEELIRKYEKDKAKHIN